MKTYKTYSRKSMKKEFIKMALLLAAMILPLLYTGAYFANLGR